MTTTMTNPFTTADSLSTMDFELTSPPLKSALSPISYTIPALLSTPALHRRRPVKRVRFALTLEPVEEDSLPSSPEASPSQPTKRSKRSNAPWSQSRPLYGNYIEYLKKQDALKHLEDYADRTPSLSPSSPTSPESTTYTHTFVIQSKSPGIFIDSITVSAPPVHLPQIIHRRKKPTKPQSSIVEAHPKQQPTLSASPHVSQPKKLANATSQRHHYVSVRAIPKRAESTMHSANGLQLNDRSARPSTLFRSKTVKDPPLSKKSAEVPTSKAPTNQANLLPDRSNSTRYLRKPRIPSRVHRVSDELNLNKRYLFRNRDSDHLLQPAVHSTH